MTMKVRLLITIYFKYKLFKNQLALNQNYKQKLTSPISQALWV